MYSISDPCDLVIAVGATTAVHSVSVTLCYMYSVSGPWDLVIAVGSTTAVHSVSVTFHLSEPVLRSYL